MLVNNSKILSRNIVQVLAVILGRQQRTSPLETSGGIGNVLQLNYDKK